MKKLQEFKGHIRVLFEVTTPYLIGKNIIENPYWYIICVIGRNSSNYICNIFYQVALQG